MASLTLQQARAILGKDAQGVSDVELQRDIEAAELLKDLFLHQLVKKPKTGSQNNPKVT